MEWTRSRPPLAAMACSHTADAAACHARSSRDCAPPCGTALSVATVITAIAMGRTSRIPTDSNSLRSGSLRQQHQQERLLSVETILRLIEDDGCFRLEDVVGDFFAAVRRQAVHEQGARLRERHQLFI